MWNKAVMYFLCQEDLTPTQVLDGRWGIPFQIRIEKGPMKVIVVFFSKHAALNGMVLYLVNVYTFSKMCQIKVVLHLY